MKQFIIYNSEGRILRVGNCLDGDLHYQNGVDEYVMEGKADFFTQYIKDDTIVDMPEKPAGEYVFNYSTEQWVFNTEKATKDALNKRNQLLREGPDRISPMWWNSMTEAQQTEWTMYRQALLDITAQPEYPEFIVWPIKP